MGFDPSEEDSNPAFSTRLEVPFRAQQLEQTPRAPGRIVEIPELPQVPVGGRRSHRGLSNRLSAPSRGQSEPHVRPEGDPHVKTASPGHPKPSRVSRRSPYG